MKTAQLIVISFFLTVLVAFLFLPLEWGLMDDSEYIFSIQKFLQVHDWISSIWYRIIEHYHVDFRAGILRPSFWIYTATVYQLPVFWAYVLRLSWYVAILFCGLKLVDGRGSKIKAETPFLLLALFCFFSIRSLYEGIALVSLQEFSGLFFVLLGYFTYFFSKSKLLSNFRLIIATIFLLLGVGFKPPFVWVLFFFAVGLWLFDKKRISAIFIFFVAMFFLVFSARLARNGFYSQEIYKFELDRVLKSITYFVQHFAPAFLVFLVGISFSFKMSFEGVRSLILNTTREKYMGLQILLSGVMYLATLLPRGVGVGYGYYFCPPVTLIIFGLIISVYKYAETIDFRNTKVGYFSLSFTGLASLGLFLYSASSFVNRTIAIDSFKVWARENNVESTIIYTNSDEVAARLREIFKIRMGADFNGKILSLIQKSKINPDQGYYLVFNDQVPPKTDHLGRIVWSKGSAILYELSPSL